MPVCVSMSTAAATATVADVLVDDIIRKARRCDSSWTNGYSRYSGGGQCGMIIPSTVGPHPLTDQPLFGAYTLSILPPPLAVAEGCGRSLDSRSRCVDSVGNGVSVSVSGMGSDEECAPLRTHVDCMVGDSDSDSDCDGDCDGDGYDGCGHGGGGAIVGDGRSGGGGCDVMMMDDDQHSPQRRHHTHRRGVSERLASDSGQGGDVDVFVWSDDDDEGKRRGGEGEEGSVEDVCTVY